MKKLSGQTRQYLVYYNFCIILKTDRIILIMLPSAMTSIFFVKTNIICKTLTYTQIKMITYSVNNCAGHRLKVVASDRLEEGAGKEWVHIDSWQCPVVCSFFSIDNLASADSIGVVLVVEVIIYRI